MRKVAILTMSGALNFGVQLQAIALKETLKINHIDADILFFQTYRQKSQYAIINHYVFNKRVLKKNLQNLLHCKSVSQKIHKYYCFMNKEVFHGLPPLRTEHSVYENLKNYNVVLVGSDQIWNYSLNDSSEAYLLNCVKNGKYISYAASLGGIIEEPIKNQEHILRGVKNFDFVSVREDIAVDFFDRHGISVVQVLDPTFLIDVSWWKTKCRKIELPNSKYIIYYSVNCKPYSVQICQNLEKYLNLPVYNLFLHPGMWGTDFKHMHNLDPYEFLYVLNHAEVICTDSYHGLIFSILFRKKFIVPTEIRDTHVICENRKQTILKMLDLMDHLFSVDTPLDQINQLDDTFEKAFSIIEEKKKVSINFLINSIKGENHDI